MSKKLAAGPNAYVFDVKTGSGAFMQKMADAEELAQSLIRIAREAMGREAIALITNMNQPLGVAIGNALEVEESILTLKNEGPEDLREITLALSSYMLVLGKISKMV